MTGLIVYMLQTLIKTRLGSRDPDSRNPQVHLKLRTRSGEGFTRIDFDGDPGILEKILNAIKLDGPDGD